MKFVVIGSNSFSGSHFVYRLLKDGHSVLGISRSAEVPPVFRPYAWKAESGSFTFLQADINHDLEVALKSITQFAPDVVVNFAAQSMVAQSWDNPDQWYQTNVVSLSLLAEGLQKLDNLSRYVHVTTPEVYGSTSDWITEHNHFAPSTPYAVSRAAGDLHLLALHSAKGFPVVFTRAANVYGPGQQLYRILPKSVLSARLGRELHLHGGGGSRRSFIHISDVAEATLQIAVSGRNGETYHISTDELVSISDLVSKTFTQCGVDSQQFVASVEDRLGKDLGYFLNSSKLRKELGWKPLVTLSDGINSVIQWVDSNLEDLRERNPEYVHKP
jgi:dTDP-glucose 4,6-dehydratase